jgi:bifunctional non-homologous end joining protein LigD
MTLREYHRKRDFQKTAEPKGKTHADRSQAKQAKLRFVVQKHAASHLHYDFRLELDGVMKSWAVPKGPSLDPAVRSLAMQVEDHPIEYNTFEGTIPPGEYGGGTVMIWDQGTWEPEEGEAAQEYRDGRMHFTLHGKRLRGSWALARTRVENGRAQWLLIKRRDAEAIPGDERGLVQRQQTSVVTKRTLDEIAADADRVWTSTGERKVRKSKPRRRNVAAASKPARKKKSTSSRARAAAKGKRK